MVKVTLQVRLEATKEVFIFAKADFVLRGKLRVSVFLEYFQSFTHFHNASNLLKLSKPALLIIHKP